MKDHSWQLSNLELSKCLKELGVKQESLWWWVKSYDSGRNEIDCYLVSNYDMCQWDGSKIEEQYSAFTVAELGEMILKGEERATLPDWDKDDSHWHITYGLHRIGNANIEANARAKMLVYLLENKLIKGVNK